MPRLHTETPTLLGLTTAILSANAGNRSGMGSEISSHLDRYRYRPGPSISLPAYVELIKDGKSLGIYLVTQTEGCQPRQLSHGRRKKLTKLHYALKPNTNPTQLRSTMLNVRTTSAQRRHDFFGSEIQLEDFESGNFE